MHVGGAARAALVPSLSTADTVLVPDGSLVEEGDTLAFRQNDRYALLREDLIGLRRRAVTPAEVITTLKQTGAPGQLTDSLSDLLRDLAAVGAGISDNATTAPQITGVDVELLSAEIMGAEDAVRDLNGKLAALTPPASPDERQQAEALRKGITTRLQFLERARTKLANTRATRRASGANPVPRLTPEQRARIDNYAAALAPDTTYVLSPQTGLLRLSDGQSPSRVEALPIAAGNDSRVTDPSDGSSASDAAGGDHYSLRPSGLPELWSTAERRDSVVGDTGRGLIVAPE